MAKLKDYDKHFLKMLFCEDWMHLFTYCSFHVKFMRIPIKKWQQAGLDLQLDRNHKKMELEKLTRFILDV